MSTGSESKGWWATLPGMLTAFAGLLTAVTGLVVALDQIGALGGDDPPRTLVTGEPTVAGGGEPRGEIGAADDALVMEPVGPEGPAPRSPGAVVLAYYDALWARDWTAVEATLAPTTEIDVAALRMVRSQAGALDQISDQLNTLFDQTEASPKGATSETRPADAPQEFRIEGVQQAGRRARVVVAPAAGSSGARHSMDLVRVDGAWKILRQGAAP